MEFAFWTLDNYAALSQHLYLRSIVVTFKMAGLSSLFVVLLGFPVALFMARLRGQILRRVILFVILLPLLMNLLLQSYGWLVILAPTGILSQLLQTSGITDRPTLFLFNQTGVLLGLVQTTFPLAVLPMATALGAIPRSLEEAAWTLGANRLRALWHVVLPLALPGILAATILTFAYNASAFVVPLLLGGRRVSMLAPLIADLMGPQLDWPLGAANAMVLIALTLVVLAVYQRLTIRHG